MRRRFWFIPPLPFVVLRPLSEENLARAYEAFTADAYDIITESTTLLMHFRGSLARGYIGLNDEELVGLALIPIVEAASTIHGTSMRMLLRIKAVIPERMISL